MAPDVYDSGVLIAKDVGGGHLQDQNGVCIVCTKCDDPRCCNRPATCEGEHAKVSAQRARWDAECEEFGCHDPLSDPTA